MNNMHQLARECTSCIESLAEARQNLDVHMAEVEELLKEGRTGAAARKKAVR